MSKNYPHLFQPIQINSLRFPNRIMVAPMGSGSVSETDEIGKSGASCYTLGSYQIDDEWSMLMGYPYPFAKFKGMSITSNPTGGKKLRELMLKIQQAGMYASVELIHAGRYAHNYEDKSKETYAIGPIDEEYPHKKGFTMHVKGMDHVMIEHVADNYAKAAVNYLNAGFDMIMLHFAHGWLPWQFLSPTFNKRTDEYGGSFENRIRFPQMIIERVRAAVGPKVPIELRIGATEFREGGISLEEVIRFLQLVEDKIDLVNISAGLDSEVGFMHHVMATNLKPHCDKLAYAAEVKKHLHIPVSSVGSFITPEEAEEAIASGKCDIVCICREVLVDPEWVKKAYEDRGEDIMPCMRCTVCGGRSGYGCASNPRYNRYQEIPRILEKTNHPQHVVIIGGGPAGIRAALFANEVGHHVTLLEKSSQLGGLLKLFGQDPLKIDLQTYYRYLLNQMRKHPEIDVKLNHEATKESVQALHPDAILVAIGAQPKNIPIPGIEQVKALQAIEVFEHPEKVNGNVVIIGGGVTAVDTALFLSQRQHKVDLVARSKIAKEVDDTADWKFALDWHVKNYCPQLTMHENTKTVQIESDAVIIEQAGIRERLVADTVVLSTGFEVTEEANQFYDICYKTYKIGDCVKPRRLDAATNEAFYRIINL